jgi:tetratricopeptide (TPR) repeat protein
VKRARGFLAQHHDYDLRALDAALTHVDREELRIPLRRKACAISSRDCIALASSLLFFLNDEVGAAAMYEQAFADPFIDSLARAADSYWLTHYYYRNGETAKAVALAEQVARTNSGNGYFTRGRLYERVGNLDGAEEDFMVNARRYQDLTGLLAFYYRRVEVDGNQNYAARWEKWRAEIFPNGMQPEPTTLTGVPKTGVFIYRDSEFSRLSGIRAGDIVVGLEGWRVDNVDQYRVINSLKDDATVRLTISRGGQLIKVEPKSPTRLFGTQLETHPMKGWIQD